MGRVPDAKVHVYSHGSDRFPGGQSVWLPVIDGRRDTNERDTNETACPGGRLYGHLDVVRQRAAEREARLR